MIDIQKTIDLFGYNPDKYSDQSKNKVVRICDKCGREQIVGKRGGYNLCQRCSKIGRKLTEEHKDNIRKAVSGEKHPNWGKKRTPETRKKVSESQIGRRPTPETRKKLSKSRIGRVITPETRKKISDANLGEKHPNWKGGISFGKYCKLFNKRFKETIRGIYHNKCFLCGKTKEENGENLSVHHVNYDKGCLCGSICEFVPLCRKCHMETNFNRNYWEDLIMCHLYPYRFSMVDI